MMNVPAHIVRANGTAVSMLMEGREDESVKLLHKTLSELRELVFSMEEDNDDDEVLLPPPSVVLQSIKIPFDSSPSLNVGAFSFFNRAIVMPATSDVTMDQFKLGAILLYNAGFCCHLKLMQTGLSRDLTRALGFYRHAFQLLTDTDAILGISDDDALLVLSLANNMGHLHSSLFDRTASRTCWDMMQNLFPASAEETILDDDDALFFYLATFLVPFDHLSASPAA
ncbi:expressed unknown protein [Seminavis robusta]|uniref:Uncharacterized protein n=1 Tax=Seminavis robusta TaxID=568900 RepID=A0A9N8H0K8_9STRA|nr:expressed unknown protein [Seminavis robusta]|eukprot:Sro22_g015320.1 n/a (226) ;mRNA; r:74108-74785